MQRLIEEKDIPENIARDLEKVKDILIGLGATRIILYGSLVRNDFHKDSDIDICVDGLPNYNYFRALAECLMEVDRRVSILDFKNVHGYLRTRILEEGKVLYELKRNEFGAEAENKMHFI
ncbi:hypothetical protein GWN42_11475 [candidate division KSB1 bacterium]|nr:hypothetical protein [candidate division KSB1 bacterium]